MSHVVHSCRFTDWKPNSISSLAFNKAGTRLAIARSNGDVELWALRSASGNANESSSVINIHSSKDEIDSFIKNAINRNSHSTFAASTQWYCENTIPGNGSPNITGVFWAIKNTVELSTSFSSSTDKSTDRLITVGINGKLVEWDTESGLPKTVTDSYGGAVWAGALSPSTNQIILGCDDGTLRLFDLSDSSSPQYLKAFYRHRGRVLSVDWLQNPLFYSNTSARTVRPDGTPLTKADDPPLVVSGGVDGLIRTWNIVTNRNISQISVDSLRIDLHKKDLFDDASNPQNGVTGDVEEYDDGVEESEGDESDASEDDTDIFGNQVGATGKTTKKPTGSRKRTGRKLKRSRVWTVKFIDAQTIVSGDSVGKIQIHETRFGTMIKAFHIHKADILCLNVVPPLASIMRQTRADQVPQPPNSQDATYFDFPTIFASGVDSKVIQLQAAPVTEGAGVSDGPIRYAHQLHWAHTGSQRAHTHDVVSMAISPAMFAIDHTTIAEDARRSILSSANSASPSVGASDVPEALEDKATQLAAKVYAQIMEIPRKFEILLVTGSVDTQAVLHSCSRFTQITPRKISPFPHRPVMNFSQYSITGARDNEVVASLYETYPNSSYLQPLTNQTKNISFTKGSPLGALAEFSETKPFTLVEAPVNARGVLFTNKLVEVYSLGSAQSTPAGQPLVCEFSIPNPAAALAKQLSDKNKALVAAAAAKSKAANDDSSDSDEPSQPPVKKVKETSGKEKRVHSKDKDAQDGDVLLNVESKHRVLAKMSINSTFNLNTAVISPNGSLVACADALSVKLFGLETKFVQPTVPGGLDLTESSTLREVVQVRRLNFPPAIDGEEEHSEAFLEANRLLSQSGSHCIGFSSDNSILAIAVEDGSVLIFDLIVGQILASIKGSHVRSYLTDLGLASPLKKTSKKVAKKDDSDSDSDSEPESDNDDELPEDHLPVVRDIKFSLCGAYIATLDASRVVRVFRLSPLGSKTLHPHLVNVLPALATPCTALSFLPVPSMKLHTPEVEASTASPANKKSAASLFSKNKPLNSKGGDSSTKDQAELTISTEMSNKFAESLVHPPLIGALANGAVFIYDTNRRVFVEASTRVGEPSAHFISLPFPAYTTNTGNKQNNISDRVYGNPHMLRDSYVPPSNVVFEKDKITSISVSGYRRNIVENDLGDCISVLLQSSSIAFHVDIPVSLFSPEHLLSVEKAVTSTSVSSSMSTNNNNNNNNNSSKRKHPNSTNVTRVKVLARPYLVCKPISQFKPLLFATHISPSASSVRTQKLHSKTIPAPLPALAFVEISWLAVLKSLPAALKRKKFGAN